MDDENYHPYSCEELEETMAAGGDIFREEEGVEKTRHALKLIEGTRDQIKKKKEAK